MSVVVDDGLSHGRSQRPRAGLHRSVSSRPAPARCISTGPVTQRLCTQPQPSFEAAFDGAGLRGLRVDGGGRGPAGAGAAHALAAAVLASLGGGRCACDTNALCSPRTAPVSLFSLPPRLSLLPGGPTAVPPPGTQGRLCAGLWVVGTKGPSPGWC